MSVRWIMALSEELVWGGYAWYISTVCSEYKASWCFHHVLTPAHVLQLASRHSLMLHFERCA
jgi:hypothetical protein